MAAKKKTAAKLKRKTDFEPDEPIVAPVPVEPPPVVEVPVPPREPFVPTLWRMVLGTDTWHFHPQCSQWPIDGYKERTSASIRGVPCAECQQKVNG